MVTNGKLTQEYLDQGSGKDVYQTPGWIIDLLKNYVDIDLDPMAGLDTNIGTLNYTNIKPDDPGQHSSLTGVNAYNQEWNRRSSSPRPFTVFLNPPFSEKEAAMQCLFWSYERAEAPWRAILLTPNSPGVKSWWHGARVPANWRPDNFPDHIEWQGGITDYAQKTWFVAGRVSFYDPIEDEVASSPTFGTCLHFIGGPWPDGLFTDLRKHGDLVSRTINE